ncbi:MAG TPA: TetR/AcrR family transcriptional regulator [Aquirhabdus sp.]
MNDMKTRDRILQKSLQLFNEQGERSISTNHIAAALEISPGNLYYHFRNKESIIAELLLDYQHEILSLLNVPEDRPMIVADKFEYFQVLSSQFWKYRFLHRDSNHLIDSSQVLKERYPIFARQVMQRGMQIYQGFVDAGLMTATFTEIEALIINIWIVMTNWSNFLLMTGHITQTDALDERWLRQGLRQMVFLEGPYLTGEGRAAYEPLLQTFGDGGQGGWFGVQT